MRDLSPCEKGNSCLMKLLGGLSYEKILGYNNSPKYMAVRLSPQQIPSLVGRGVWRAKVYWDSSMASLKASGFTALLYV